MIKLGLVGRGISHSRSQVTYEELLEERVEYLLLDYENLDDVESLEQLFSREFNGLSITYPYKAHYLESSIVKDPEIRKLNAINCIRQRNGVYEATNTDYLAAGYLLVSEFSNIDEFILLGSGNMARVFEAQFKKLKLSFKKYSRKENGDLNNIDYLNSALSNSQKLMIINCCSRDFVFTAKLPRACHFWDMNYSFESHDYLKRTDAKYIDGLNLLKWQAKFALDFWELP